jgi:DNA helicase HerA-like ATPase
MNLSQSELRTLRFYEWENWGRGVNAYDIAIDIEPPFHPFFNHTIQTAPYRDDTKKETILSSIANIFQNGFKKEVVKEYKPPIDYKTLEPYPFKNVAPLKAFSVSLPKGGKVNVQESEQLLIMLSYSQSITSFEIIATQEDIKIQFVCRSYDADNLRTQVKAYFPEAVVQETEDSLGELFTNTQYGCVLDFGLREEFMRPINTVTSFNVDPHIGLLASMEALKEGEFGLIQVLFKGAVNPWSESILRSVSDSDGSCFFEDAPEMLTLSREKISSPLFGVVIRVLGAGNNGAEEAQAISLRMANALMRLYSSKSNSLVLLNNEGYNIETRFKDIIRRESHRLGMLLNSKELVAIVHPPSASVASQKLVRDIKKSKQAPDITQGHKFVLGINVHQGKEKEVSISSSQRTRHFHLIGASGVGKSTLILNMVNQDLIHGNAIAVLDPHGDLIDAILSHIPQNRLDDVLIIDPADSDYPIGFNILSAHSEIEKEILSSDLVAVFRRLSTSWGDQMNSVFANAILAFLESSQGGTLADLRRFLIEKPYRDAFLKTVNDPNIIYYWQKEYPLLKSSSIGSILTRLDTFLRPKLIRNMVAQKKGLDFEHLMDSKKIILVKLSQGLIGAENSYLLGTVIVSKIYQSALSRQTQQQNKRSDFFLYVDEFQNFITPSMSGILSGARKFHLGLILAHQGMEQIQKYDSELASSIISNVGTRICFRLGDTDAKKFADGFSFFETDDLQGLNTGQAIVRIDRPDNDFNIIIEPLESPANGEEMRDTVIAKSRVRYATPRSEVESVLKQTQATEEIQEEIIITKPTIRKETAPIQEPIKQPEELQQSHTKENLIKQKERTEHRYLQAFIKKMAESRGYKALLEEPTPDGKGRVDVSLEKNGGKIACEICVTTTDEWELHNIEKCINAGYDTVIAISRDKKALEKIQRLVKSKLSQQIQNKVFIFEPEEFFLHLDNQSAKEASTEERIKGYRVKVNYTALSESEAKAKQDNILKVITKSERKI